MPAIVKGSLRERGFFNLHEAADYLGLSHGTIKHHVYNSNLLPVIRVNQKSVVIEKGDLDSFNASGSRRMSSTHHTTIDAQYNVEMSASARKAVDEKGLEVEAVEKKMYQLGIVKVKLEHILHYFS